MNNVLIHHGILGQKWGVRRYQRADGTLTAAGKAKYGSVANLEKHYIDSSRTERLRKTKGVDKKTLENSKALDRKVNERIQRQSDASAALATAFFGGSTVRTYQTSRAVGESAGKAVLRSIFDINLAQLAGGATTSIMSRLGGGRSKAMNTLGRIGGLAVQETVKSSSLQERALYNKYDRKHR